MISICFRAYGTYTSSTFRNPIPSLLAPTALVCDPRFSWTSIGLAWRSVTICSASALTDVWPGDAYKNVTWTPNGRATHQTRTTSNFTVTACALPKSIPTASKPSLKGESPSQSRGFIPTSLPVRLETALNSDWFLHFLNSMISL